MIIINWLVVIILIDNNDSLIYKYEINKFRNNKKVHSNADHS